MGWGTPKELETWRRIHIAVYAYAYEFMDDPLVSDGDFDKLAKEIDLSVETGNAALDFWFEENFTPDTGVWVREHPNIAGLDRYYQCWKDNL